jgi:hypothetical protein
MFVAYRHRWPAFQVVALFAKGVDSGAEFRFGLVRALDDASEVVAKNSHES